MNQEEAREAISAAIHNYLKVSDLLHYDDELMSSWALVVHMEKVEDDGYSYYARVVSSRNMPEHVKNGLFYEGFSGHKKWEET